MKGIHWSNEYFLKALLLNPNFIIEKWILHIKSMSCNRYKTASFFIMCTVPLLNLFFFMDDVYSERPTRSSSGDIRICLAWYWKLNLRLISLSGNAGGEDCVKPSK